MQYLTFRFNYIEYSNFNVTSLHVCSNVNLSGVFNFTMPSLMIITEVTHHKYYVPEYAKMQHCNNTMYCNIATRRVVKMYDFSRNS